MDAPRSCPSIGAPRRVMSGLPKLSERDRRAWTVMIARPRMRGAVRKVLLNPIVKRLRTALYKRRRLVFGILGMTLLLALVSVVVTASWVALLATILVVIAILAGMLLEARRANRAHRSLEARVVELERYQSMFAILLYDQERASGHDAGPLPASVAPAVGRALLDRGDVLDAHAVLTGAGALPALGKVPLRRLRDELRKRGYLDRALEVARIISDAPGEDRDLNARKLIQGEIAVLSGEFVPTVRPEAPGFQSRRGRVLHVVGNSLPGAQSGYTLRTHYTAVAQKQVGLDPHVVTQMGVGHHGDDYAREDIDGITYHRLPGPARGSEPFDLWMRRHVQRLANLVRVVRPVVLHAASDFINAQAAEVVGREFGIPVVYESRGFWEETWLSRQAQTFGWDDLAGLEATHGLPDVYVWRRAIEDRLRRGADRVVTLADVMADRIEAGGVARERIAVIPNGVDVSAFPLLTRNQELASRLGLSDSTTVIGYISSVVEYEGIDTLIAAYATVKASTPSPVALLIVGEGAVRERLMAQASGLGLDDVIFTGRVAHDAVLDYYSVIDIFVVPRRPVEVCHLVTPLKPFEAFSTGRAVVLSNVRALAQLAAQSGAAELFDAGDEQSLASVLLGLLKDPQRRDALAAAGAAWVRTERTWAANAQAYVRLYEQVSAIPVGDDLRSLIRRGFVLDAYSHLVEAGSLSGLDAPTLRRLRDELRRRGYLRWAQDVARLCVDGGGHTQDTRELAQIEGEIAVLSGGFVPSVRREDSTLRSNPGRVLHVVGNSLPGTQSGYTLRTHYTAVAQRDAGLDPHVVTQMGVGHDGDEYISEEVDGVTHHRIPGPARGAGSFDDWMGVYAQRLANVVRVVRPVVLHAASDFINAQAAEAVGQEFGIPVVYESRGFWEETWLSRQAQRFGWDDLERLEAVHGLPDVYLWRRETEDRCRLRAHRVVTLADGMAERIEAGGVARERIAVIPNGVDVAAFPVLSRNLELAAQLGIDQGTTVIGYISSLVDYEGIDTLISAYAAIKVSSPMPVALLIVGDGPVRERLMGQARALGLEDAIFTGRVTHDVVPDYYSLIDIFVVPRKPVEVCHLVTPLKPFEAFSTGRTVVLSNVRALTRIAEQSGAAELFEAGDDQSLLGVLTGLLKDPQRRRELAAAGTAWVRSERTWDANADAYVRLYESMGVIPMGEIRIRRLAAERIDIERLRRALAAREPIPFEILSSHDASVGADEVMVKGWSHSTYPVVHLDDAIDWTTAGMSNRSWNFRLHSWDFMGPVLRAFADTGERRYLDWCVDRAVSWARVFNDGDARGTMAWYDMALGLRGHRLALVVEQALLCDTSPEKLSLLLACVVRHQQEYFADAVFNARSNHGVYLALGELALARRLSELPAMDVLAAQGRERMDIMARTQFARDGGHVEHSPEYHRMVVGSFGGAIAAGLLDDDEVRRRVTLAEEVLGWFIQPNGELVQIGDSIARQMRSKSPRTASASTEFLVSAGRRSTPNDATVRVLPDSGYAVIRSPQPTESLGHEASSYLLLAASFHSRTHKHADDLTITWFDHGHEILIDAGRYGYVDLLPKDSPFRLEGYYYSSAERQYVESTRAHNTVEADGRDQVRRGREPYGSAIGRAEERNGYYRVDAEVDHGGWLHHRDIVFRPGHWLLVTDVLTARDDAPHDFRQWWNLPEEIVPTPTESGGLAVELPGSTSALWVVERSGSALIAPVTAQREPVLRGWRSKHDLQFTPAWSTGFEAIGVRAKEFRTLFCIGDEAPTGPFDHPFVSPDRDYASWAGG